MAESQTLKVKTTGMHCQSCAMLIRMNLEETDGVQDVKIDVPAGMSEVTYDPDRVTTEDIVKAIETAGYGASVE